MFFHLQVKYGKRKQCKAKFNVQDAAETAILLRKARKNWIYDSQAKCANSNRPLVNPIQETKAGLLRRR